MKYTAFGKTGLRVSQVALGTGNFGTGWGYGADRDVAEAVFNAYAEAGGQLHRYRGSASSASPRNCSAPLPTRPSIRDASNGVLAKFQRRHERCSRKRVTGE